MVAYTLMIGAWVMSTRPFAAPDEAAHYLRALTIANGTLLGPKDPNTLGSIEGPISPAGRSWQERTSRGVLVSANLSPPGARCLDGHQNRRGRCVESTYTGNYQPLPYLLPALGLKASHHVSSATWLARGASAIGAIGFLVLAIAVLWDGTPVSVLGLAIAVTPMVLFVSSAISPSGLEIAASTAFLASLLRLARAPAESAAWVWAAVAISGAVTVMSWQLGPLFALIDIVVFGLLVGRRMLAETFRRHAPRLGATALVLFSALVLYALFVAAANEANTTVALDHLGDLHSGFNTLPDVLEQSVGVFGRLDVPVPSAVEIIWYALAGGSAVLAFAVATRRERLLLLGACALAVLVPTLYEAFVQIHTGFGLQGRYVLPVLIALPLLSAEILRARAPAPTGPAAAGAIAALAGLQLVAWWVNARSSAGHPGSIWFLSHAVWSPPLGWWPWLVLALAGAALLALSALTGARFQGPRLVPASR
jgi:hypothetical protein